MGNKQQREGWLFYLQHNNATTHSVGIGFVHSTPCVCQVLLFPVNVANLKTTNHLTFQVYSTVAQTKYGESRKRVVVKYSWAVKWIFVCSRVKVKRNIYSSITLYLIYHREVTSQEKILNFFSLWLNFDCLFYFHSKVSLPLTQLSLLCEELHVFKSWLQLCWAFGCIICTKPYFHQTEPDFGILIVEDAAKKMRQIRKSFYCQLKSVLNSIQLGVRME